MINTAARFRVRAAAPSSPDPAYHAPRPDEREQCSADGPDYHFCAAEISGPPRHSGRPDDAGKDRRDCLACRHAPLRYRLGRRADSTGSCEVQNSRGNRPRDGRHERAKVVNSAALQRAEIFHCEKNDHAEHRHEPEPSTIRFASALSGSVRCSVVSARHAPPRMLAGCGHGRLISRMPPRLQQATLLHCGCAMAERR